MEALDDLKKKFNWGDGIIIKRSVSDLLWGYNDSTLSFINSKLGRIDHDFRINTVFAYSVSPERGCGKYSNVCICTTYEMSFPILSL